MVKGAIRDIDMRPTPATLELARWIRQLMLDLKHTSGAYRKDVVSDKTDEVLRRAYMADARSYYPDQTEELMQVFDSGLLDQAAPS
jgi:hypothetical protein